MHNVRMTENPAYVAIMQQITDLNATWTNLQYLMDTAPKSKNPLSTTNRCIRAQKLQCKVLNKKVDSLYDLINQLQIAWEATSPW